MKELLFFNEKFGKYRDYADNYLMSFSSEDIRARNTIRGELQRIYSSLEDVILEYADNSQIYTDPLGKKSNVFEVALKPLDTFNYYQQIACVNQSIMVVNKVIGKLEARGRTWEIPVENLKPKSGKIKIFISHSGNTPALSILGDFLEEDLGFEKLVVVKEPNLDRNISDKVKECLDRADIVIILATSDAKDRDGNPIPSPNVIHEIGLAQSQSKLKGKIIYLLEEGTKLNSNTSAKGYVSFNRGHIQDVFGSIVKELRGMGFLG